VVSLVAEVGVLGSEVEEVNWLLVVDHQLRVSNSLTVAQNKGRLQQLALLLSLLHLREILDSLGFQEHMLRHLLRAQALLLSSSKIEPLLNESSNLRALEPWRDGRSLLKVLLSVHHHAPSASLRVVSTVAVDVVETGRLLRGDAGSGSVEGSLLRHSLPVGQVLLKIDQHESHVVLAVVVRAAFVRDRSRNLVQGHTLEAVLLNHFSDLLLSVN